MKIWKVLSTLVYGLTGVTSATYAVLHCINSIKTFNNIIDPEYDIKKDKGEKIFELLWINGCMISWAIGAQVSFSMLRHIIKQK